MFADLSKAGEFYRDALLNDVLPFWMRHGIDKAHGGFFTCLDRDGSVIDTDKGVWAQARATWLFGELYNTVEPRKEWLDLALHGAEFLEQHAFDDADGRMWFHLEREGRPLRKRRYSFTESFAAIAFGELAQATGNGRFAERAQACFERFLASGDAPPDPPKFTNTRPLRGIGHPMIMINTAQQLRDSIQLPEADKHIDHGIEVIRSLHMKEDLQCVVENVSPIGEIVDHFDGRTLNPGHAIEAAWFILEEARIRKDKELTQLGARILDWMWRRGWDPQYGGLLYFVDLYGKPVQEYWHDMKFWWPHNEAIIATLLAHQLTREPRYQQWWQDVHTWSFEHFADPQHGEWFGYLHRDGRLSVPLKGNLWKGPFHLPRMLLKCWQLCEHPASMV